MVFDEGLQNSGLKDDKNQPQIKDKNLPDPRFQYSNTFRCQHQRSASTCLGHDPHQTQKYKHLRPQGPHPTFLSLHFASGVHSPLRKHK